MKTHEKDGTPVKITRRHQGPTYLRGHERAMVCKYLTTIARANPGAGGSWQALRDKAVFEVAWLTGMRVEELFHLDLGDVCDADSLPHKVVVREFISVVGKGNVYREIPVTPQLAKVVEEFIKVKRRVGEELSTRAPFFCAGGGERLSYRSLQSIIERVCIRVGLTKVEDGKVKARCSIHDLRHTFAIMWLGAHDYLAPYEALRKLADIMGHESTDTTQKYTRYDVLESERG